MAFVCGEANVSLRTLLQCLPGVVFGCDLSSKSTARLVVAPALSPLTEEGQDHKDQDQGAEGEVGMPVHDELPGSNAGMPPDSYAPAI